MEELLSKEADLEQGQLMSAIVAMSSLVCLQEFVRIMGSGLEMHQFVKVSRPFSCNLSYNIKKFLQQYAALVFLIHPMGEWISEAINQETEQATSVTAAMSYKVTLLGFARTMDSGLEMHQLVNVKVPDNYHFKFCDE